jgi:short-subunit dehydrogenase
VELRDRVAVVTGASSGIGYATARALASRGAIVVGVARREERLRELAEACQRDTPQSGYIAGDLGLRETAERVVRETEERHGRVDILINNAGIPKHKLIYRVSVEEGEETLRVNFLSALWTSFAAIPGMLARESGVIVNVSSFASKVVPMHETLYAASKCALNGFTRGLSNDLRGSGIHVCLVHPGPIDTEIWGKLEQSGAYDGKLYSADRAAREILTAISKRRHEVVVPRFSPQLIAARMTQTIAPAVVRASVARMDPVPAKALARARQRAREGKPMGKL